MPTSFLSTHWIAWGALSAIFLGLYDIAKKKGLDHNAVPFVLVFASLTTALILIPLRLWSGLGLSPALWTPDQHLRFLAKSVLVTLSWLCTYQGIKHLPLSISAPIRSSAPVFTILGAVLLLSERPTAQQWIGIGVALVGYWLFSLVGRIEGIHFAKNRWVGWMVLGTLLGSLSGMYDKVLLNHHRFTPSDVQLWFTLYNIVLQSGVLAVWLLLRWRVFRRNPKGPASFWSSLGFAWRWSIPMIGVLILIADRLWFEALHCDGALVGVLTVIRRSGVVVSFLAGGLLWKEKNQRKKAGALLVILAGLALLVL